MPQKNLPLIEHLSGESQKLFDVLNDETDLAVILVTASYLDACLGSILKRKLIDSSISKQLLDPRSGALGSYSTRADVCYALGLIQKPLYTDLKKIAEIRNEIAHYYLTLNFQSESIQKLCGELLYVASLKNGNADKPLFEEMVGPRNQFVLSAVMISQRLLLIGLGFNHEQSA